MKRDMELIRKILLFVEGIDNVSRFERLEVAGYSSDAIYHHVRILLDQGYLREKGGVSFTYDGVAISGGAMTYEGHDFLDAARSDTIWRKAMDKVTDTTGSVSIDVLKALLIDIGKQTLGL
ncbi:hypothetical protein HPO_17435 [Hyphomonas polymorpha PS728]|uniref:DUF2513 domain-containing protein n=1 Tax=Hyphomonas polymorpha PS728 TaxID=1280954 RepID=A0A062VEN7_9PROT|nr:DUF2513 domain-containing protein [Hyphomonas polymorpha]KCZ96954.1 hypothetical protein HPO_17435 [Hyphomonas polymorpha PS728]